MGKARIKLIGTNEKEIDQVCQQIKQIAQACGVEVSGPIFFTNKKISSNH
jgi:SSU ribosomal protein S10P